MKGLNYSYAGLQYDLEEEEEKVYLDNYSQHPGYHHQSLENICPDHSFDATLTKWKDHHKLTFHLLKKYLS